MKKTLIATAFAFLSIGAQAAGSVTGTVTQFGVDTSAHTTVYSSGTISGTPACNTQARFAVSTTTDGGKNTAAFLSYAAALGKTLQIVGTGACTVLTDSEDISYIVITN